MEKAGLPSRVTATRMREIRSGSASPYLPLPFPLDVTSMYAASS